MDTTMIHIPATASRTGNQTAADGQNIRTPEEKALFWEALRDRVNTIGARAALDDALTQLEGRAS